MVGYAKVFGRSAFGIGCAIGLILNFSLLPLLELEQRAEAAMTSGRLATFPPTQPPDIDSACTDVWSQGWGLTFGSTSGMVLFRTTTTSATVNLTSNTQNTPVGSGTFSESLRLHISGLDSDATDGMTSVHTETYVTAGPLSHSTWSAPIWAFETEVTATPDLASAGTVTVFIPAEITADVTSARQGATDFAALFASQFVNGGPSQSACLQACDNAYNTCIASTNTQFTNAQQTCADNALLGFAGCTPLFGCGWCYIACLAVFYIAFDRCMVSALSDHLSRVAVCKSNRVACYAGCGVAIDED